MTRKIISWLSLWAVFLFILSSCVHDEVYSASDPDAEQYHSKSVFKEDERYIKNVMVIYNEHEEEIKKTAGTPLWDYAMTMGHFDESFLIVPVTNGKNVVSSLQALRNGDQIRFVYDNDKLHSAFFQNYIYQKEKKPLSQTVPQSSQSGRLTMCSVSTISMWYPDNENEFGGSGHWETQYITTCSENPGDGGNNCTGYYDSYGHCMPSGYEPPTYPYTPGGAGGNSPQTPPNPCEKTESILNKPNVQSGINNVKAQALSTLSNINAGEIGFKEKKDGTIAPSDVNAAHKVIFNDVTDGYGGYHNHTANGAHMFSPPDIADTLLGFAAAQDNVGDAYFGMIAAEWCTTCPNNKKILHYVIQYTGEATDLGNGGSYNFTQTQINQFISDYLLIIKDLTNKSLNGTTYIKNSAGDLNEKGLEKLFFETLIVMGMNGKVNLQRIESNGTIYNVTLDNNNMPVGIPCP